MIDRFTHGKDLFMVTNLDQEGIDFIAYWECGGDPNNSEYLHAYEDQGGLSTIGIGIIQYPNGAKVKMGDVITPKQRDDYFAWQVREKVAKVNLYTRDDINQSQLNSLVDFAYNEGTTGLQKSTLLKTLNNDLTDIEIVTNFLAYRFVKGKEDAGLTRRRMGDAYLFFTGKQKFHWTNFRIYSQQTINEVVAAIKTV